MKCPEENCKGEIYLTKSLEREKKKYFRVLNHYCPICGWMKIFRIDITKQQYKKEQEGISEIHKL